MPVCRVLGLEHLSGTDRYWRFRVTLTGGLYGSISTPQGVRYRWKSDPLLLGRIGRNNCDGQAALPRETFGSHHQMI
ncbi:hypothetical protein [uncultured Tateyamaria sp.]|uniref:hypothetical protein n=1 Tax=uncultured Tateyamaria sp. TaxID=455651 RepID=UPI002636072E|nr:hypothetical protein [uncultured Tateyamaria sp.]